MGKPLILVVEDNTTIQRLIQLLADRYGLDADIVSGGNAALDAIASGRSYSMVLMDWLMPDMDGLECTRRIRDSEKRMGKHIPIIAMTANAGDEDRQRCLECGMDDYMSKPFNVQQFGSVVSRWLETQMPRQCS